MSELPDWARRLDLSPHPEGGWFRETWRSELDGAAIRSAAGLRRAHAAPERRSCSCSCPASSRRGIRCAAPSCGSTTAAARCCSRSDPSRTAPQRICSAPTSPRESTRSSSCRRDTGSGPAPATTNPAWSAVWWSPASTSPTSRWPAYRLSISTAADTSAALSWRRRTVRQPQRVLQCRCGSARRACPHVPAAANNFRRGRAAAPAPVSLPPSPG